jgi:hypothetical protein
MASDPIPQIGQKWLSRRVVTFNGQHDSHIETGDDYETLTLQDLFTMEPGNSAKSEGLACIPSSYREYDARVHKIQQQHGSFVALTADIDSGNHALAHVQSVIAGLCRDTAWLIYSSAHARGGDMRWRAIIPLHRVTGFEDWNDAQNALFNLLDQAGLECDRALERAGQPVYLPNVPEVHAKSGERLRGDDGAPLFYQRATSGCTVPALDIEPGKGAIGSEIAAIKRQREADERERQRLRSEAERRRLERAAGDNVSIIDEFNAANSVATMLQIYGYEQSLRNGDDWRSPYQTSGSYATRVFDDKWVSLSGSDVGARIGRNSKTGCYGDAFDLFLHFQHGGDTKAAFRELYAERRASTFTAPSSPPHDPSDPGWTEIPPGPEDADEMVVDVEASEPVEASAPDGKPRLPFLWFNDAAPNLEANDFVEGLLTAGSMSVIYGPSNCGKTFFVLDLALHVAWGREWRGKAVDRGAIVYLSLEGAQGIQNRITAFRTHHGCADLPFVAMPRPVDLLASDVDVSSVIELVHYIAAATDLPVRMVVIDTLSRAMAGGNENSPEDMTALIGNCDRIRDATGSHICIVHHSGKDEAKGARGHSSLRAATDTEIEIKRDPELTRSTVKVVKQRDLEADEPVAFTLQSVALGTNRRGKPVTSCVVIDDNSAVVLGREGKLSPKEKDAWQALLELFSEAETHPETGEIRDVPPPISSGVWRRVLEQRGTLGGNNEETRKVQFRRIRKALIDKLNLTERDGYIFRGEQGGT